MKTLVYTKDITLGNLFVGAYYTKSLTISGRIYKKIRKLWFRKPKYTYTISIPFIEKPFYDGEYGTNRILKAYSIQMKQHLIDKIQEFKENGENEGNDNSRASKEKEGFGGKTKLVYP